MTTELETIEPGKPGPKSKRTSEIQKLLCEALANGCTYRAACAFAGISESEFYEWKSENAEFAEIITRAENQAEAGFTSVLGKAAAAGDWRAALEWLKRRRKSDWSEKIENEVNATFTAKVSAQELNDDELATIATRGS